MKILKIDRFQYEKIVTVISHIASEGNFIHDSALVNFHRFSVGDSYDSSIRHINEILECFEDLSEEVETLRGFYNDLKIAVKSQQDSEV